MTTPAPVIDAPLPSAPAEYMEVVTRSIRKLGGDQCATNLEKAFNRIKKLVMTDDGLKKIQNLF